jgi:hypothetical protein
MGMKKRNLIIVSAGGLAAVLLLSVFVIIPAVRYGQAVGRFDNGQFTDALEALGKLPAGYRNADELYPYYEAYAAFEVGNYQDAERGFARLGNYEDSASMRVESNYQLALSLLTPEEGERARAIFIDLGDYKDSEAKLVGHAHRFVNRA